MDRAQQLEKVLEVDLAQLDGGRLKLSSWLVRGERREKEAELEAVRTLRRRCLAVKFASVAYASSIEGEQRGA